MRTLAAIAVGVVVWMLSTAAVGAASHVLWPAYAAAAPTRSYTLAMLVARLATGALALVLSARLSTTLAGRIAAGVWVGGVLLVISAPYHVSIWRHYPAWYHLTYLGYLLPLSALGARLAPHRGPKPGHVEAALHCHVDGPIEP